VTGTEAGSVIAAAGLAGLLVWGDRCIRAASFVAHVAGAGILAADLLQEPIATMRVDAGHRPLIVLAELGPLGLAAALAAVMTSSLSYNAYFEDPASWILTALIAAMSFLPASIPREASA
jgi:hypothetical protein